MPSDPFQMAMIHRTFRNEFGHISGLVRAVASGDTKRSGAVGSYCDNIISVLHHHHAAEDEVLWPKLQTRAAPCGDAIDRAEDEHRRIQDLIDKIQAVRPAWQGSADPALAEQLAGAVEELSSGIDEHFDHEEQSVVPLIVQHITAEEWQKFIDRGAAYVNPRNLWFALAYAGFLMRDGTPDEQRRFIEALPLPLRLTLKLLGGRANSAYRTKLYGNGV